MPPHALEGHQDGVEEGCQDEGQGPERLVELVKVRKTLIYGLYEVPDLVVELQDLSL